MSKKFLTLLITICAFISSYSQNINLDEYEIYLNHTLIAKSDFIKNSKSLSKEQSKNFEFKPITNGIKKAYFLNGKPYSAGKIENLKENGFWEYWHSNGQKAREGEFIDGKPNGTHKYWYENGNLRAIGNWEMGIYEGKWEMYGEDGKDKIIQNYKDGKQVP